VSEPKFTEVKNFQNNSGKICATNGTNLAQIVFPSFGKANRNGKKHRRLNHE